MSKYKKHFLRSFRSFFTIQVNNCIITAIDLEEAISNKGKKKVLLSAFCCLICNEIYNNTHESIVLYL